MWQSPQTDREPDEECWTRRAYVSDSVSESSICASGGRATARVGHEATLARCCANKLTRLPSHSSHYQCGLASKQASKEGSWLLSVFSVVADPGDLSANVLFGAAIEEKLCEKQKEAARTRKT